MSYWYLLVRGETVDFFLLIPGDPDDSVVEVFKCLGFKPYYSFNKFFLRGSRRANDLFSESIFGSRTSRTCLDPSVERIGEV